MKYSISMKSSVAFLFLVLSAGAVAASSPPPPPPPPPPPAPQCDAAYALGPGGICFNTFTKSSNWGWTNPLLVGTNVFDLYAGAAQCDTSKGIHVGHIVVTFTPDFNITSAEVQLLPPLYIQQTSVYVGPDLLPKDKKGKYTSSESSFPFQSPFFTEEDNLQSFDLVNIINTEQGAVAMFSAKVEACGIA